MPEDPEPDQEPGQGGQEPPQEPHGARRDPRYREQLQQAQAEVERLQKVLAERNRAEAERLAADRLADPGDLWRSGVELAALVEGDELSEAKLSEAVKGVLEDHPHYAKMRTPPPLPHPPVPAVRAGGDWASVLDPRRGR